MVNIAYLNTLDGAVCAAMAETMLGIRTAKCSNRVDFFGGRATDFLLNGNANIVVADSTDCLSVRAIKDWGNTYLVTHWAYPGQKPVNDRHLIGGHRSLSFAMMESLADGPGKQIPMTHLSQLANSITNEMVNGSDTVITGYSYLFSKYFGAAMARRLAANLSNLAMNVTETEYVERSMASSREVCDSIVSDDKKLWHGVFELNGNKSTVLVCFDQRFYSTRTLAAMAGPKIGSLPEIVISINMASKSIIATFVDKSSQMAIPLFWILVAAGMTNTSYSSSGIRGTFSDESLVNTLMTNGRFVGFGTEVPEPFNILEDKKWLNEMRKSMQSS
jgi:hypothetical protein